MDWKGTLDRTRSVMEGTDSEVACICKCVQQISDRARLGSVISSGNKK